MRKITDIPLFIMSNKGNKITDKMISIPVSVDRIPQNLLEESIQTIDRRFSYPMKARVVEDYKSGLVIPVFNKNITLNSFVPSFMVIQNSRISAIVNFSNVPTATMGKDGSFNIDNRTLFALLHTGSIMLSYATNFDNIKISTQVSTKGAEIFSKLLCKILDKNFAINLNRLLSDTAAFMCAKYFLIYHMERANDDATNDIAYACTSGQTTKNFLVNQDKELVGDIYSKGFTNFIAGLSQINGLKKINSRLVLNQWLLMYGETTLLALEYLPYFYHMVFSSMIGGRLNKEYVIENVASKQIIDLNNELSKVIKR